MLAERTTQQITRELAAAAERDLQAAARQAQLARPAELAQAVPLTQFRLSIPQEVLVRHTT
jgi:hypothetical protein